MDEYITTYEVAEKWGVTARRVQLLCSQGRVTGAIKRASTWFIPKEAEKPIDRRAGRKATRKTNND